MNLPSPVTASHSRHRTPGLSLVCARYQMEERNGSRMRPLSNCPPGFRAHLHASAPVKANTYRFSIVTAWKESYVCLSTLRGSHGNLRNLLRSFRGPWYCPFSSLVKGPALWGGQPVSFTHCHWKRWRSKSDPIRPLPRLVIGLRATSVTHIELI